jgi:hypothetical protein
VYSKFISNPDFYQFRVAAGVSHGDRKIIIFLPGLETLDTPSALLKPSTDSRVL